MGTVDDEIKKDLEKIKTSIDNMDVKAISESIGETVNKALGHVATGAEKTADYISKEVDKWSGKNTPQKEQELSVTGHPNRYTYSNPYYQRKKRESICVPPSGKILGKIASITGSIGTVLFSALTFLLCGVGHPIVGIAVFVPFVIFSVWSMIWGLRKSARYTRYQSYVREMGGKPFVKTERLAKATGKSLRYTIKDIREMIRDGVFPSGKLSDEEDYLMLTKAVYEDYIKARDALKTREKEEQKQMEAMQQQEEMDEKTKQLQATIREGREYLRQIEEANDIIETKEFSEKLFRLQIVIDKIFYCVEQNPEKLPEIKQFMEYYLPTTLKLVNAYRDFYLQPVQGENITSAKVEIEKAIDTINVGFENLLNDLFKQDVLDITTDIYVLESMLEREGLTETEFEKMKRQGGL